MVLAPSTLLIVYSTPRIQLWEDGKFTRSESAQEDAWSQETEQEECSQSCASQWQKLIFVASKQASPLSTLELMVGSAQ